MLLSDIKTIALQSIEALKSANPDETTLEHALENFSHLEEALDRLKH